MAFTGEELGDDAEDGAAPPVAALEPEEVELVEEAVLLGIGESGGRGGRIHGRHKG